MASPHENGVTQAGGAAAAQPDGHAHDAHGGGHGGHGGDHVPHVLPLWIYLATWGTLLVLTIITVAVSYLNLGSANLLVALLIATIKATVVALMFMHLRYDKRFHGIIFSFSIIFLGIFIAFTMFDTETRGRTDQVEADRSVNVKAPFKQGQREGKVEDKLRREAGVEPGQPAPAVPLEPPR